ncbi:MAG: Zn-dependent protease [candidate division Zixibacteria bacterium SM23_81]|nr:MAG: Zn-dependent protease [candidate division Zixibacteria bacterium SM23_81]
MRASLISTMVLSPLLATTSFAQPDSPLRPITTYSIVARDSVTGQLGVAVQSHWFSVGPIVPWAEAGVGAVATQSFAEPAYGPLGLELMRVGRSAPEALKALVSTDADEAVRQVAMVDTQGRVAAHTGGRCIQAAGHHVGNHYSVQANLMESSTVWEAMAQAYESAQGDLAERLLVALEAAEGEGGDLRGRQSAAILIVSGENSGKPWVDRLFDLRVEDHPDPVAELRRLVQLQRAYIKLNEGDELWTKGNVEEAMEAYRQATNIVPDQATNGEAPFWVGVTLAASGQVDEAIPYLARAYQQDTRWAELVTRLPNSGLLPKDQKLIDDLVRRMKKGSE